MKLINYTLLFLSGILFLIVSLWAVLFYFQMLNQVKATIDEGLANYKILVIDKLKDDNMLIEQNNFPETNYLIKSISEDYALKVRDTYKDTLIFSSIKNINEPARLLTTAFISENGFYYEMKIISQELDKGKLIRELATSLMWLYLFLFFSIIMVNNFVLKRTWKPFYHLVNYLEEFRLDKLSKNEGTKTNIKEFSRLNSSVQKLLDTNVNIYQNQKQFIENASHELQTPLAIGINKLELLAGEESLSEEQVLKIGNIIETFQRLSGLNKSLLLLSKIENKQFSSEEQIDLNEIFDRVINDFSDYTKFREIKIEYEKENSCLINMNRDLAEILILDLVKNAIFHNKEKGHVQIKLSDSSFTIENTSDEPALNPDRLFERFNRNPNKKGSTGLGLAICHAIAGVSGLSLNYYYNKNHVFEVSLKQ